MAEAILAGTKLSLTFEAGLDEEGKMKYKTKNYNNVKVTATTDGLYAAAQAIVGLQGNTLDGIERKDSSFITP